MTQKVKKKSVLLLVFNIYLGCGATSPVIPDSALGNFSWQCWMNFIWMSWIVIRGMQGNYCSTIVPVQKLLVFNKVPPNIFYKAVLNVLVIKSLK